MNFIMLNVVINLIFIIINTLIYIYLQTCESNYVKNEKEKQRQNKEKHSVLLIVLFLFFPYVLTISGVGFIIQSRNYI